MPLGATIDGLDRIDGVVDEALTVAIVVDGEDDVVVLESLRQWPFAIVDGKCVLDGVPDEPFTVLPLPLPVTPFDGDAVADEFAVDIDVIVAVTVVAVEDDSVPFCN